MFSGARYGIIDNFQQVEEKTRWWAMSIQYEHRFQHFHPIFKYQTEPFSPTKIQT